METTSIVHRADCMEGMKALDQVFDLACCDPPYFNGPQNLGYYGKPYSRIGVKRPEHIQVNNWGVPGQDYFDLLRSKSNMQIVWGINYYGWDNVPPGRIIWDKANQASTFSDAEVALCTAHSSVSLFRYMWNGMLQGKSMRQGHIAQGNKRLNEKRIHPTQKPVLLYEWIFKKYAKPGQWVLDTHVGSGSSRIAADRLGLNYIGFEISPEVYQAQEQRWLQYQETKKQMLPF